LGKGSVFTVSLPTYDIEDPKPPKPKGIGGSTAPKDVLGILKVLVVDDAKMNLKLLMRLVSKKGHKVDGAEDGAIAVDKASKAMDEGADYDVILMDYQMPNMDGPTATRILRSKGCNAFICGVTGNVMAEDIKHFKKCGANAVLHKPAKIKALEDLWIEYGVRGEIPPAEGVHDGVIEEKPKRVQINATASSAYHDSGVSLSLSSLSIGLNDKDSPEPPGHKKATRVNMAGAVLSQSENSPEFPSSRRTNGTGDTAGTDDSDLWGSKLSDTFAN
jgi:CheY-like chemotaxis protein